MSRLDYAIEHIEKSRQYSIRLIDSFDTMEWFRTPIEGGTHLGWQVAHLAVAEYRLALCRLRGHSPRDGDLISEAFIKKFGKDSVPDPGPAHNPPVNEIKEVFANVHKQAISYLKTMTEAELDQPVLTPHPHFHTRLGCLWWIGQHEMLHAGQIGLLRRLLGKPPLW